MFEKKMFMLEKEKKEGGGGGGRKRKRLNWCEGGEGQMDNFSS